MEKLTENKIRIMLNIDDLKSKNIDLHTFMSNSIESQDLFLDMLDEAEKKLDFCTKDNKLIVEVIATSEENFILTVTKLNAEENNSFYAENLILDEQKLLIYKFNNFEDFSNFCSYINTYSISNLEELGDFSLYLLDSNYYLVSNLHNSNLEKYKDFLLTISEFACLVNKPHIFNLKLKEYGKVIIPNKAISVCSKYF